MGLPSANAAATRRADGHRRGEFSRSPKIEACQLTDNLVELFINLIRRINARAERRVEKELLADIKRVSGKTGMLFQLAAASLENPEGLVQDVIFPVVNEATLRAIVKEDLREHLNRNLRS